MATTVQGAFTEFMAQHVNLDASETSKARSSRDWLRTQLGKAATSADDFPHSYEKKHIDYGSFARRTKKRQLDDIDIIHCFGADGAFYTDHTTHVSITAESGTRLANYRHIDSSELNSRRMIRRVAKYLSGIEQYSSGGANQNGVTATLRLKSYTWDFDIAPGFLTAPTLDGRSYYLIPDGRGHWMKTDPRVDRERITRINKQHGGRFLDAVRLSKFWNRRPTMPSVLSYTFEALVARYYEARTDVASPYLRLEFMLALEFIASNVHWAIQDPKGIDGDINTLSYEERTKVSERAQADAARARAALVSERDDGPEGAIRKWREILGPTFPPYTG